MARPLRIQFPDAVYSITSRGLGQQPIVIDDQDRRKWLELLDRIATRRLWRIYAWVLMTNHYHLFFRTVEPNLSVGMHDLNSGYAACFNRRHSRKGPLFEGRFHSVLVEADLHDLELTRYLHLNPVRAKMVDRPETHPWSSYRDYLGIRTPPAWLDWKAVLRRFGVSIPAALETYARFHARALEHDVGSPFDHGLVGSILGSRGFVEQIRQQFGEDLFDLEIPESKTLVVAPGMERVGEAVCRVFGVEAEEVRKRGHRGEARHVAIYLVRMLTEASLSETGKLFGGVGRSAVSQSCKRTLRRIEESPDLAAMVEETKLLALRPKSEI